MPKTPNRRLTYKERVQILTLHKIGWKVKDIAQWIGVWPSMVSHVIHHLETPIPCTDEVL
jgi:IS30 family transposase